MIRSENINFAFHCVQYSTADLISDQVFQMPYLVSKVFDCFVGLLSLSDSCAGGVVKLGRNVYERGRDGITGQH